MYKNYEKILAEKGLTTYRVCKETGISQTTMSEWKNGRSCPKVDKLIKIAKFLGCSLDDLLGEEILP